MNAPSLRERWTVRACRFAALLVVALLAVVPAFAQQPDTTERQRVDLEADSLFGTVEQGEAVRLLVGDVRLRQGDTHLWSDRATQYVERDEILFTGDVQVVERGDSLWADSVLYDSRTKVGRATGNVELTDGDVVVYAPLGRYFTDEKRAEFEQGVRLIDSLTTLTSRSGTYWSDEKRAEFYVDVRLVDSLSLMLADSVTYLREREVARARGDVGIERLGEEADSATRTFVFGQHVYDDASTGYSRITGQPLVVQLRTDTTTADSPQVDTLLVRAVRIETVRSDSLRHLVAVDSVRFWQHDLSATADSAIFDRYLHGADSTREDLFLFDDPMAWFEQGQIHADTMHLKGRNGSADTLFAQHDAFLAQLDTTLQRIQQLQGHTIVGIFEDDSLRSLTAGPQAESIYYLSDENEAPDGAVRVSGDRVDFAFRAGTLRRLRVLRGIEGTRYPEGQIPQPFQLARYRWVPQQRPEKEALMHVLPARRLELLPEVSPPPSEPATPPPNPAAEASTDHLDASM